MKKLVGSAIWLAVVCAIWTGAPAVAVGLNVAFRPGYVMREFGSEYSARLRPDRVHWFDFKAYRLSCPDGERRAVVLHTNEFAETPDEFLARRFPDCPHRAKEEASAIPEMFSGIAIGRW